MLKRIMTVGCALLLGAALAACAVTPSEARTQFCSSLNTLEQTMAGYEALGPNATIGQYKDGQQAVNQAWQDVLQAGAQLSDVKADTFYATVLDLQQTVYSLPESTTVEQALATVQPKVVAVKASAKTLRTTVACA
ncbi:MAG: hypothetical protein HGA45_27420 [Chloroflexales bacterium]|nr:hypothetical protein [Chloroflexales bacterium]